MSLFDQPTEFLKGIIAVPATPFTERDQIDEFSLRRYVRMALDDGVCGFLVPALAAEVYMLTHEERLVIIRTILNEVGGAVPVIGSATADTADGRRKAVEELGTLGCEGILVYIPYENESEYVAEVMKLEKLIGDKCFLMLQDWDLHGSGIPVPVIAGLFDKVACFRSLKIEVAFAGSKYTAVLKACRNQLHVAGGWASNQMIEGLDRGVKAFMPTVLHRIYKKIFDLHKMGERDQAVALFNRFLPVLAFTRQHPEISIHFNKRLLHRQGIFNTYRLRQNTIVFDAFHERLCRELIDAALALSAQVARLNST